MERLLSLAPSAFAATMVTAALAVAAHDRGYGGLSVALLWVAVALFFAVAALLAARVATRPRSFWAETATPGNVFGVFALAAALALLADRLWLGGYHAAALAAWIAGVAAWTAVGYAVPMLLITARSAARVEAVSPAWTTPVIATQTLVASATLLSERWAPTFFLFAALAFFLIAWGLYLVVGSWVGRRLVFGPVEPDSLTGHHWLPIAALATSGFAATRLVVAADNYELVASVRPVLEAFAVTAWTGCSAWLGLVVALDVWRGLRAGPRAFAAPNAAFPTYAIAAYAIASHEVGRVFGLDAFGIVAEAAFWVGLAGAALAAAFTVLWIAGRPSVAHEH